MNFTLDFTPILLALEGIIVPIVLGWVVNQAWKEVQPYLVKYLGAKNAMILQERFSKLADHAIAYAVQAGGDRIARDGGITVGTRNIMVDWAVGYANDHAADLSQDAGMVTEKMMARFDTHPAVKGLLLPPIPIAQDAA